MPELTPTPPAETTHVEHVDEQIGPYRFVGTVTYVQDPEAVRQAHGVMVRSVLARLPELLLEDRRRAG